MLHKIIYLLGIQMRNRFIDRNYSFLKESERWPIEKLEALQLERLKSLVLHAYENSEYYRKKFNENNIKISDFRTLEDLQKIPVLSKDELLKNSASIQTKAGSEKLFYSETSGSTGKPLVFYRNQDWDAWHRASIYRGYSWYGVRPWERNGYLWGYNFSFKRRLKTRFFDFLQNRFRLFSYKDDEIEAFARKLSRASFLSGYSSMIYEVAKKINTSSGTYNLSLKMVKGTSEKIFDTYQAEVKKAFGHKMISEYGAAEAGIIAFECPNGNMHINMETAIVQLENDEIIITNLVSKSFPIIRYKLGDYVVVDKETKCACGRQHYIIKEVLGRLGKVIYGYENKYPSLTLYYVFKNLAMEHKLILNYQAVQSKEGLLKVNLENSIGNKERELLEKEFLKYFSKDLDIEINDGVNLKSTNKKKADFISEL